MNPISALATREAVTAEAIHALAARSLHSMLDLIAPRDPAKPSAVPAQLMAAVRWGSTALGAVLLNHGIVSGHTESNLVGGVMFVVPLIWSIAQKAAANRTLRAALIAPAIGCISSAIDPKTIAPQETKMTFFEALEAFKSGALAAATAALTDPAMSQALTEGVDALEGAAKVEVDKAAAALPPALQPFAPTISSLLDDEASRIKAEADAKIASLTSAQVALSAQ